MCHYGPQVILQKIPTGKCSDKDTEAQISLLMHVVCLAHGLIKEKEEVGVGSRPVEAWGGIYGMRGRRVGAKDRSALRMSSRLERQDGLNLDSLRARSASGEEGSWEHGVWSNVLLGNQEALVPALPPAHCVTWVSASPSVQRGVSALELGLPTQMPLEGNVGEAPCICQREGERWVWWMGEECCPKDIHIPLSKTYAGHTKYICWPDWDSPVGWAPWSEQPEGPLQFWMVQGSSCVSRPSFIFFL